MIFRRRKSGAKDGADDADGASGAAGERAGAGAAEGAAASSGRSAGAGAGAPAPGRGDASDGGDGATPIAAGQAVDCIAELLRTLGEHAFDVGELRAADIGALFEGWARHVLIGTPAPGRTGAAAEEAAGARRDLPGLRRAFRDHRIAEARYVTTSLVEFREATWAFISGLRRTLSAEQAADRRISHRMRRLEGAVRSGEPMKIKSEAQETVTMLTELLAERGARHQEQIATMASRLEALRAELDSVRAQAAIDAVTLVYNRASFDEQIEREVDLATLFGKRGCLIMVDIDHFKWVNDTHGHPTGDHVLREMATTLTRCFKRKDDFVARYGGEEFAIVLRDIDLATARTVADRAMGTIRMLEIERAGLSEPIRITASMGIARLRTGEAAASWIERADRALYQAKNGGRDRIEVDPIDLEEK